MYNPVRSPTHDTVLSWDLFGHLGSVALIHMPSKSFRRWNLDAIRLFLEGAKAKQLKGVTVSTLLDLEDAHTAGTPELFIHRVLAALARPVNSLDP